MDAGVPAALIGWIALYAHFIYANEMPCSFFMQLRR